MHLGKKLLFTIITLLLVSFSLITALDFPSRNTTPKSFAPERPQEPWLEATIPNGGSIFAVMEQLKIPA
ncbi:MAG: hypothetical protein CVU48_05085, partial [Candidatus Cloacimonetes bacterium HGW-Cloacimonetes-1]